MREFRENYSFLVTYRNDLFFLATQIWLLRSASRARNNIRRQQNNRMNYTTTVTLFLENLRTGRFCSGKNGRFLKKQNRAQFCTFWTKAARYFFRMTYWTKFDRDSRGRGVLKFVAYYKWKSSVPRGFANSLDVYAWRVSRVRTINRISIYFIRKIFRVGLRSCILMPRVYIYTEYRTRNMR